jgi:hypothetical protein
MASPTGTSIPSQWSWHQTSSDRGTVQEPYRTFSGQCSWNPMFLGYGIGEGEVVACLGDDLGEEDRE